MSNDSADAAWISLSWGKDVHPLGGHPVAFRRRLRLESVPDRAPVRISASPSYRLWVNGVEIAQGPARSYPQRQLCDELDLTPVLRTGENVIAVLVLQASGVTGYSLVHRSGLWMEGWLNTDDSWEARPADWFLRTPWLYTLPLGPQEHCDARAEPAAWTTGGEGGPWGRAFVLGPRGTPPWTRLETSPLPLPRRFPVSPPLVWAGEADSNGIDLRQVNPAVAFNQLEFRTCAPEAERVWVFDFGKTCTVSLGFAVLAQEGPVRVELYTDIRWTGRPEAGLGFGHAEEGCVDSVEIPGAGYKWRGSRPRGLRFLTVRLAGPGTCRLQYHHEVLEYPFSDRPTPFPEGSFEAKVWEVSRTTLRAATTDQIGEPARENVLWTFDACVAGKAAWHTFGESKLWRHCLRLIADGIGPEGVPHAVVPSGDSFMVLFDQALLWVVSCADYVELTGDLSLVGEVWGPLERLLTACSETITPDGLFIPPPYAWHWVDWAKLDKRPYSFPVNGLLLWAAQAALNLGRRVGRRSSTARKLAGTLKTSLLGFWDTEARAFRSRLPHSDGRPWNSINTTHPMETTYPVEFDLHSNALAWWTGLGTKVQRRGALRKMLDLWSAWQDGTLGYGPLLGNGWTHILLAPLFRGGAAREAAGILRGLYQPWLDQEVPTWGEDFRPSLYNTAHGWGACVNSLLAEEVLGRPALEVP